MCLCPSVLRKVEHGSNEIGYLAEEVFKQHVEEAAWFIILDAYNKGQEERNDLKGELLIRREAEFKHFKNS